MNSMTNRRRLLAILRYESYDRMPVVHFGYWNETLLKWAQEGHITEEEARGWGDGNPIDATLNERLGFDFDYYSTFHPELRLFPAFERKVIRELPDGKQHVLNPEGVIVLEDSGAMGIAPEIEVLLKDRASWREHYLWRYQWDEQRVLKSLVRMNDQMARFDQGGLAFLQAGERDYPYGLHCGSLFGQIRNVLGVEGSAFLLVDDEPLFDEFIQIIGDLSYRVVEFVLKSGAVFDFAHFWEDICFKNGPLIAPDVFAEKVGPHYKRITDLLQQHGLDIVSLDCDGMIDALIPAWFANGVNTMFPIEVGTWNASIAPWREKFGRELRGVGGMNKTVFAQDRAAIDAEIERLKPLVALGGFIPCPDHRIAPDAKWDLVRYYCERMRKAFG